MEYRINLKMDIAVIDKKYPDITKHRRKKPIGDPVTISGTEEEIVEKINAMVYNLIDLATDVYVNGEENVTLKKGQVVR